MVGEGVLLTCLESPEIEHVLIVNRKPSGHRHPKLEERIVPDFFAFEAPSGYDACFFCAGVSSVGMKEPEYRRITHDLTLSFAKALANPGMVFTYVSGAGTNPNGRAMWARVKGDTENDLMKLPFRAVYNFRPGFMRPWPGQKNVLRLYKYIGWLFYVMPSSVLTMQQVGLAMIHTISNNYPKNILEIKDIRALALQES